MRRKATEPQSCRTQLLGYCCQPMTILGKILTPLFLIVDSWLRSLILYKPLDSSWSGEQSLEAWAYCVSLATGWELKSTFYYLQTLSPHILFSFGGQRKARFWLTTMLERNTSQSLCHGAPNSVESVSFSQFSQIWSKFYYCLTIIFKRGRHNSPSPGLSAHLKKLMFSH